MVNMVGDLPDVPTIPIRLHFAENLQGIRSKERFQNFFAELNQYVCDIMMISETWRAESKEMYVTRAGGWIFLSGDGHHQGVGICTSATLGKLLNDCNFHAYSYRV